MQSERSTTELHLLLPSNPLVIYYYPVLKVMEKLGFEPRTFHMQSERSTTELHPLLPETLSFIYYYHCRYLCEVITHISQCWLHVVIVIFY